MMGGTRDEPMDLNVLAYIAELDTDNQESFSRLKKDAQRQFEEKIFARGHAAGVSGKAGDLDPETEKKNAEAAKARAEKIMADKKSAEKKEHVRQWNLTPPDLRKLLPAGGAVAPGTFWMRWHPVQRWWRVTYPTRPFSGLSRCLCL